MVTLLIVYVHAGYFDHFVIQFITNALQLLPQTIPQTRMSVRQHPLPTRKVRFMSSLKQSTMLCAKTVLVHRRKSLADILHAIRPRQPQDDATHQAQRSALDNSTPTASKDDGARAAPLTTFTEELTDQYPRLDILSELPSTNLQRSSTFRVCVEKAVNDINSKYGMGPSTAESKNDQKYLSKSSVNVEFKPIPPRSYFRPEAPLNLFADTSKVNKPLYCACNSGSKTPAHWVDKILEQSLRLRSPSATLLLQDI